MDEFLKKINQGFQLLHQQHELPTHSHPRELIFTIGQIKLYHYQSSVKKTKILPVLIVFAMINRPNILDLTPETSFVNQLLAQGLDVYLLDWGDFDVNGKTFSLADCVLSYLPKTVNFIKKYAQVEKINMMGICQGGVLSLSYASLHHQLQSLILISTPIDFQTKDNVIYQIIKNPTLKIPENEHCIRGEMLTQFFLSLRPFELMGKKYLNLIDRIDNTIFTDKFLRIEKWLHDTPNQSGPVFTEMLKALYLENRLYKGEWYLGDKLVDCRKINIPVLNVIANQDDIVPPSASKPLKKLISAHLYQQTMIKGGHIGIYVSEKLGKQLPKVITSFLKKRGGYL